MRLDPSSRTRLSPFSVAHFADDTLFCHLARTICQVDCLPRKELFEAWEVARRTRRRFRGGRVVDLACGHGLLAHIMLLLDDTSPSAIAVDTRLPKSAAIIAAAMVSEWPRLAGRVTLVERGLSEVELGASDVVVSAHACGGLTDEILDRAVHARARVAVLPCCHAKSTGDQGGLEGWLDHALGMDVTRAGKLRGHGYRVYTQRVPEAITPKNRLLLGMPLD